MRSDRFQPNNDNFPSFRHSDMRLAQVNRFEGWQRKAALRFSRKSGEHWSRGEAKSGDVRGWRAKFVGYSGEILKEESAILSIVRRVPREIGIVLIQPRQTAARCGKFQRKNFHVPWKVIAR